MMDQRCPTSEDARVKWSNCVTTVGAWLAIFACLSALYRLSGLHAQFLRAESGYSSKLLGSIGPGWPDFMPPT